MFDEYLEPPRTERPVPTTQEEPTPINSAGTPLSNTLLKKNHLQSTQPQSSVIADLKFFGSTLDSTELYKHHKTSVASCFRVDTGQEGLPITLSSG
uniref:Uncharacterized protein n=1 Tax=Tanacetum cinerariifolium TaxID=118510 RepID=A0A699QYT2_TANCI|nr:hypothetical protein [Tanacetum cinerariifolium]